MKKENPLKVKRKQSLGINRDEMAKKIGVSFYTVQEWELSRNAPSASDIIHVLRYGYEFDDSEIIKYLEFLREKKGDKNV